MLVADEAATLPPPVKKKMLCRINRAGICKFSDLRQLGAGKSTATA
jgi:hypothetical protein